MRKTLDWGLRGTRNAAARNDAVVLVDVLSFSTTAVTAIDIGAIIYPYPMKADATAYGATVGATVLLGRRETAQGLAGPGLSPRSFNATHAGQKYFLCSLNGALCSYASSEAPLCLLAGFINAQVTAEHLNLPRSRAAISGITVIACGETWADAQDDESQLRPCIEDLLCAGLLLSLIDGEPDAEAAVAVQAYLACAERKEQLLRESLSGRELSERGYSDDVDAALMENTHPCVVKLERDHFVRVCVNDTPPNGVP